MSNQSILNENPPEIQTGSSSSLESMKTSEEICQVHEHEVHEARLR